MMVLADILSALQYAFVRNMFLAGCLASVACGIIGTYVVVKRLVFISGGISHTCFGGIGLAYLLGLEPMLGALLFAVATAVVVGVASMRTKIREDSTIGVLWVMGMALGIIFIKFAPGYVPDPMSILFGNILMVKSQDLWLMLFLVVAIVVLISLLYRQFLALTFDQEFAKISGVSTERLYILLLVLVALTVVLLLKVVGVILVIALLTIPATVSSLCTHNMKRMMVLAIFVGLLVTTVGSTISWQFDLPTGPTIVIVAGVVLVAAIVAKRIGQSLGGTEAEPVSSSEGAQGS